MKKQLFFIFTLFAFLSSAQPVVFMPQGAKWHYNFDQYTGFTILLQNNTAEYTGDTIINNETVKILHHPQFYKGTCYPCNATVTYIKQHGDTIFMKNSCLINWQILYNFAAQAGEQWTVATGNSVNLVYVVTVTAAQTTTINGMSLRQLKLSINSTGQSQNYIYPQTITERIGGDYIFYFNTTNCDGRVFKRFLCYQDDTFPLHQPTSLPCDYKGTVGLEQNNISSTVLIYPNPASDHVTISNISFETCEIIVTDLVGKIVKHYNLQPVNNKLEMPFSQFQQGIYFLQVYSNGNLIAKQKILKQ